jgi:hypothetical protein
LKALNIKINYGTDKTVGIYDPGRIIEPVPQKHKLFFYISEDLPFSFLPDDTQLSDFVFFGHP